MSIIRVIVADDHPLVLKGISDFIDSQSDVEVLERCIEGQLALEAIRELKPDVAVLDLSMPDLSGLAVLQTANSEALPTRIVLLSAFISSRDIMTAMAEGARGILVKDCAPDELLRCVRNVAAGEKHLPYELFERVRGQESRANAVPVEKLLTASEWTVASLAAQGLSNKEIARKLEITEGTAKIHLHHVFRKLQISNRTALAQVAFRHSGDASRMR
jgi:two-component system, NarL family, nitrate/nitrite response regulator NarL